MIGAMSDPACDGTDACTATWARFEHMRAIFAPLRNGLLISALAIDGDRSVLAII
jgi:hypothetical protein